MRWKLVLVLGFLASGIAAAALVRAQDGSGAVGVVGLRSGPTPATPLDASNPPRTTTRSSSLAERLSQVRRSVANEYNAAGDASPEMHPMPESGAPVSATTPPTAHAGIPSVLKRDGAAPDAPQIRTATNNPDGGRFTPPPRATAPANKGDELPASARPLGALPAGARPLGSPVPPTQAPKTASETDSGAVEPPDASLLDQSNAEAGSSRRGSSAAAAPAARTAAADDLISRRAIESTRVYGAASGKEAVLVGAGPQLRLEALGPKAVVRGRPESYTLVLSNLGESTARSIEVRLESRQDVEFSAGQTTLGGAEMHRSPSGGAVLLWSIPELPRGAKAELSLTAATRETRPFELLASWTCEPTVATASIEVLEPQLAMSLSGPKDVMFGETKIYTITLTNPGTGDVENVMLALAPLASSQEAPQPRNIGSLRAGERKEIPIQLTAREAGVLAIRAEATADGGLRAEASEEVMVRKAQVQLTIDGPPLKYAGSSAEYQVRVANVGNAPAEDITVIAAIPAGVEYAPGADGGTVQSDGVAWRIGNLAPQDERTFTFHCAMAQEGDKRIVLQARGAAEVQATAMVATRVEALADLKLVINDPPGAIPVGKEVTYEVRVINRGTKAASGIEISAFFSEGIEPTAVEGLQGRLGPGQVTAGPVASLEAGAELLLKIKAKAEQPGNHIFRAVIQCTDPETRLAAEETTRFFGSGAAAPTPPAAQGRAAAEGPAANLRPGVSVFQPVKR